MKKRIALIIALNLSVFGSFYISASESNPPLSIPEEYLAPYFDEEVNPPDKSLTKLFPYSTQLKELFENWTNSSSQRVLFYNLLKESLNYHDHRLNFAKRKLITTYFALGTLLPVLGHFVMSFAAYEAIQILKNASKCHQVLLEYLYILEDFRNNAPNFNSKDYISLRNKLQNFGINPTKVSISPILVKVLTAYSLVELLPVSYDYKKYPFYDERFHDYIEIEDSGVHYYDDLIKDLVDSNPLKENQMSDLVEKFLGPLTTSTLEELSLTPQPSAPKNNS